MIGRSVFLAAVGCASVVATLMVPRAATRIIEAPTARYVGLPLVGVPLVRDGQAMGIAFIRLGVEFVGTFYGEDTTGDGRLETLSVDAAYDAVLGQPEGFDGDGTIASAALRAAVMARLTSALPEARVRSVLIFQNDFRSRAELRGLATAAR